MPSPQLRSPVPTHQGFNCNAVAIGAPQHVWQNCAANRQIITNTNALQAAGIRASSLARPAQSADSGGLMSAQGSRFIMKPQQASALMAVMMILGTTDGVTDPNNLMIQWILRGYSQHLLGRDLWIGTPLMQGYAIAGDAQVHAGSPALPLNAADETAFPTNYDANWADTIAITGTDDWTLGASFRPFGQAADAAGGFTFDVGNNMLIELEMTCLTDGATHDGATHAAAGFCTALFRSI